MKFSSYSIVYGCCFLGAIEISQVDSLSVESYPRHPFITAGMPRDSVETARIVPSTRFKIPFVLGYCAFSKVLSAIIQGVVIFVVAFFFGSTSKNDPCHEDAFLPLCTRPISNYIKRIYCWVILCKPVPLTQPLEVFEIDNRILPLRERDESVSLIQWLGNGMPFVRFSWHVPISTRNLLPSHFIMVAV